MSERLITVCAACLRASCWQGEFYCEDARRAGTIEMPVSALEAIDREHPYYWDRPA